jgi:hypothetical protein
MVRSTIDDAKIIGGVTKKAVKAVGVLGAEIVRLAFVGIYVTGALAATGVWMGIKGGAGAVVEVVKDLMFEREPSQTRQHDPDMRPQHFLRQSYGPDDPNSDFSGGDSGGSGSDDDDNDFVIGQTLTVDEQLARRFKDARKNGSVIKIDDDNEQKGETKEPKSRKKKPNQTEVDQEKARRKEVRRVNAAKKMADSKGLTEKGKKGYSGPGRKLYEPSYRQFTL